MELFEENLSVEDRIESIIYRLCRANPQYKKLSAVYCGAVLDCIGFLYKQGYIK